MEARAEAVVVDGSMLLDCSPAAARLRAPPAAVAVDASRPALRASELYGRAFLGRRFGDVAVARGAVAGAVRDAVFAASTRRSLTLFPGAPGQRTFSQTHHRALGAALRPSAAAWAWLARSAEPWQLRAVPKPNLQPDFNVSVFECFDTSSSAGLRELDESNRFVQKSAESTSI